MGVLLGTVVRLVVMAAVIAAVALAPTLFVYRSRCHTPGGHVEARWRVSLPGHQKRLPRCGRPEQGLHFLARKVGVI